MDRRKCSRLRARIDALVHCDGEEGAGVLAELSYSGALVEECALRPPVGTPARLYLFLPGEPALELSGRVGRHTESGLALVYALHDVGLRRRVDAVIAHLAHAAAS